MNNDGCCCYRHGVPCCFEQLYGNQVITDDNFYYSDYLTCSVNIKLTVI